MIEPAALDDVPHPAPPDGADPRVAALEARVAQLEQLVAALQDTRALEERVVERVSAHVKPSASGVRESAGLLLQAGRQLLPAAVSVLAEQGAPANPPPPPAAVPQAAPAAPPRQRWLILDLYAELRAMVRMYFDPRFRLSWQGRLAPLILLPAIALSGFWLPLPSMLNTVTLGLIEKVVNLLLAFVLFHVLHREATRYRATSPDLPSWLRL